MTDWIAITVAATRGSTPREAGATMQVWADAQRGSIGGGALEWQATQLARDMLADGTAQIRRNFPLGPDLGQCCGGAVTLDFIKGTTATKPMTAPLWIWGAGHVGRAIAAIMAPMDGRDIFLVDVATDRFPHALPEAVSPLVATDPVAVITRAPDYADHIIVTYSHALDLKLCDALLRHGFESCGLIGSATKWARFRNRLGALGHGADQINRIICPIGDPGLGKHPQAIAVGVAAHLISQRADISQTQPKVARRNSGGH